MADRRCFHRKILESDSFRKLPATTQILYVHLCMAADDDGFINIAESISGHRCQDLDPIEPGVYGPSRGGLQNPSGIQTESRWNPNGIPTE